MKCFLGSIVHLISLACLLTVGCDQFDDTASNQPNLNSNSTDDGISSVQTISKIELKPPIARRHRLLGIDIADLPQGRSYDDNVAKALEVKAGATSLSLQWNQVEVAPQKYTDPGEALTISNVYYPSVKLKLSLNIRSVDTVTTPIPSDLVKTKFDSPLMISRYQSMLDWVFEKIPNVDLVSLQIGNELDLNSISTPAFWEQYSAFASQVTSHVHLRRPGTLVGFTVTHGSAEGKFKSNILAASNGCDVIGVTYYPLTQNSIVLPVSVVEGDFAKIISAFGTKPIYVQEVGYPTGKANRSSELLQAQFLEKVFEAWDQHADKIPYLSIDRLVDYSHSGSTSMAADYGFHGNVAFTSFLETIGMQSHTGKDKAAVATLKKLTQERDW